ncbi:hypothetical protein [Rouxiella badensis]|uniref:hypothetical protein n=1 Tax=Rouxiella badensis TaxID=1646377 RepID=UPI003C32ECCB
MTKQFQLAKLYRRNEFLGYGIAVDGELLSQQESTTISTNAKELPKLNAQFHLKEQQAENPIIIHLD